MSIDKSNEETYGEYAVLSRPYNGYNNCGFVSLNTVDWENMCSFFFLIY